MQSGNIRDIPQLLDEKTAVGGHIGYDNLDHKIMFTANYMEFHHLGEGGDLPDEFAALFRGMFFQRDVDEEGDKRADTGRVEHGAIVIDDACGFEPFEPFECPCCGGAEDAALKTRLTRRGKA